MKFREMNEIMGRSREELQAKIEKNEDNGTVKNYCCNVHICIITAGNSATRKLERLPRHHINGAGCAR